MTNKIEQLENDLGILYAETTKIINHINYITHPDVWDEDTDIERLLKQASDLKVTLSNMKSTMQSLNAAEEDFLYEENKRPKN